jgi:23S rRNA (cytidine1920-2'-O)/16S rRNA (cytidine1409-2'-O)-methyltransferase
VAPRLIVCDLSFVSLAKVIGVPLNLAAPNATLIALFKPQFEVGRENVGRAGLVTDQEATKAALAEFLAWLTSQGWTPKDPVPSPIAGGDGNREWLVCARRDQ